MTQRRGSRGFTLIELMIVVAIIGILARLAIPTFKKVQCRAKQTEAKLGLRTIATAEMVYFGEHGRYVNIATLRATTLRSEMFTKAVYYGYTMTQTATTYSVVAQDTVQRVNRSTSSDIWAVSHTAPKPVVTTNACQ